MLEAEHAAHTSEEPSEPIGAVATDIPGNDDDRGYQDEDDTETEAFAGGHDSSERTCMRIMPSLFCPITSIHLSRSQVQLPQ